MKAGLPVAVVATAAALSCFAQNPPTTAPGAAAPPSAKPVPTPSLPSPAPAAACCRIAAGTVVSVELSAPVSSASVKTGDHFALRLAEPLTLGDVVVIPAGTPGGGDVIDAASGGLAGRPAKLVLAARFIDYGATRIPLRGFHLDGGGHDNSSAAIILSGAPYIGLLAIAIPGGNVGYKAGTRANAHVTADVVVAPPSPTSPADTPGTSSQAPPTAAPSTSAPTTKGSQP